MGSEVTGLVIGYGSIGRRHARALKAVVGTLAIVNRREEVRRRAQEEHPCALVAQTLEELDGRISWPSVAAVISTLGPSHRALFDALADRGVKRILCEKPMACSVADAQAMADRAEREGIALGLNHTMRYSRLAPVILEFAREHDLGELKAVVMKGGAACLLTNGIHWIDFAIELFGCAPLQVISTARGDRINPRSPELMYYGGTAAWGFAQGREAVLSFSNQSSVFPHVDLYFRDAVVTTGFRPTETDAVLNVTLRRRSHGDQPVARTGVADKIVWDGLLSGSRTFNEGLEAAVAELVDGGFETSPASVGVTAVATCIGALISAREGMPIVLPIVPRSRWGEEIWPIS